MYKQITKPFFLAAFLKKFIHFIRDINHLFFLFGFNLEGLHTVYGRNGVRVGVPKGLSVGEGEAVGVLLGIVVGERSPLGASAGTTVGVGVIYGFAPC